MNASDIARAIAVLTLEHDVLPAKTALALIDDAAGNGTKLVQLLQREVDEIALLRAIASELRHPFCDLYSPRLSFRTDENVLRLYDVEVLRRYAALPMVSNEGDVVAMIANPSDMDLRNYITSKAPNATFTLAPRDQILSRLALASSGIAQDLPQQQQDEVDQPAPERTGFVAPLTPRSPLIGWFDNFLDSAVAQGASDIHFEIQADDSLMVRLRVDGILRQAAAPARGREMEVMGMVMNRAQMDAANYFEPQDGQFSFTAANRGIDVRVAMLPQVNGPSIVMRLLDSANVRRRLSDMGFSPVQLDLLRRTAASHEGMVIVSGPTGSGKTTTLYALLREASSVERKVVSIEDPVEYRLPLVNQVQVRTNTSRPLTFSRALRAMLRMDPDVILVGEIRDAETASTALDASITGHLVFTTVHARDSLNIYSRLVEIGAPAYLVAEAVSLSVAQRLVRRVHDCAVSSAPTGRDVATFDQLGLEVPDTVIHARGCDACGGSGYRGRIAVVETLVPSANIKEMVRLQSGREEMLRQAREEGFLSLADNAARLVADNLTTIDEVYRVVKGA
jgi:type II secretory ATPase GspE/PulE/Tfp pilus assembly ATPase PilB-like protein